MNDGAVANRTTLKPLGERVASEKSSVAGLVKRYWCEVAVVALSLLLWAPRLPGPIDLRWDGGVYYLLGTSLATGQGYRIPSEPGSPQAMQYPPLLPLLIAAQEKILGTRNPAILGSWLRRTYFLIFIVYALSSLALARRYLPASLALLAAILTVVQVQTVFLSDLLFAELPFALVTVGFVLVVGGSRIPTAWREITSFLLAATGFLLRTAGIALLGAWIFEAAVKRQWLRMIVRAIVAVIPVIFWQSYVAKVHASYAYSHPAYRYQRAPYQYYNVSYGENVSLIDPFRPELGLMTGSAMVSRLGNNFPGLFASIGEEVSTVRGWQRMIESVRYRLVGREFTPPEQLSRVPSYIMAVLVATGFVLLLRRSAWPMAFVVAGTLALIWTTPWPGQFSRYMMPLGCFMAISVIMVLSHLGQWSDRQQNLKVKLLLKSVSTAVVFLMVVPACYMTLRLLWLRMGSEARVVGEATEPIYRLFSHDRSWQAWEKSAQWIMANSSVNAITATTCPQFFYLRTGRQAVLPPMEESSESELSLLGAVPVTYVIIDELVYSDIARRYAAPAMADNRSTWRLVYSIDGTLIYQRQ